MFFIFERMNNVVVLFSIVVGINVLMRLNKYFFKLMKLDLYC